MHTNDRIQIKCRVNRLTYTGLVNKAGKPIQPTDEAFQAAASNADRSHAPGSYLILTDQSGDFAG